MADSLDVSIKELRSAFESRHPQSAALHTRAMEVMPGGNSRTQLHFEPFPFYVERASGPFLHDVDGHRYVDVVNNYTSLIHGHPDEETVAAIGRQAARGTAYAAPSTLEVELAGELVARIPSMEQVRFTNSGTEAVLYALRLARHATNRPDIVKVEGGYHGGGEPVQVSVKRLGEAPVQSAPEEGVPQSLAEHTHIMPFDDIEAAVDVIRRHGRETAAVILEPIQGFGGALVPPVGFLEAVADATRNVGALLILDEIQTLRFARGGLQERWNLQPDITVLGKLIGGGLPVGAFGGAEDLMKLTDPRSEGSMSQSGTFNANPLTMAAGLHALRKLTDAVIDGLNRRGDDLRSWIETRSADLGLPLSVTGFGSLMQIHPGKPKPTSYREAAKRPKGLLTALFYLLMEHGVFTAPSRPIVALSTVIVDEVEAELRTAMDQALTKLAALADQA